MLYFCETRQVVNWICSSRHEPNDGTNANPPSESSGPSSDGSKCYKANPFLLCPFTQTLQDLAHLVNVKLNMELS
jgi:hypothetical protein